MNKHICCFSLVDFLLSFASLSAQHKMLQSITSNYSNKTNNSWQLNFTCDLTFSVSAIPLELDLSAFS